MKYVVSSLLGGISQKDREDRTDSQFEEQVNLLPDPSTDLRLRDGLQVLLDEDIGTVAGTTMRTSDGKAHAIIVDNTGTVRLVDPYRGGARQASLGPSSYLACAGHPRSSLSFAQVGDTMLIANNEVSPATEEGTTPTVDDGRIVRIDATLEGVSYGLNIDGTQLGVVAGAFDNPDTVVAGFLCEANGYQKYKFNTTETDVVTVKYDGVEVASATNKGGVNDEQDQMLLLISKLNGGESGLVAQYLDLESNPSGDVVLRIGVNTGSLDYTLITFEINGTPEAAVSSAAGLLSDPLIGGGSFLRCPNGQDVTYKDGLGGTGIELYGAAVESIADLPGTAFHGRVIRVEPQSNAAKAQYFVFVAEDPFAELSNGSWLETTTDNTPLSIDEDTMPVLLTWNGSAWSLGTPAWQPKPSAADTPRFLDQGVPIQDVTFYRGRICFLVGTEIFAGRTDGDLYNVWQKSPAELLETDPIQVIAASGTTGTLKYFQQLNGALLAWGTGGIAVVNPERPFNPLETVIGTFSVTHTAPDLRPQTKGNFALFVEERSNGAMPFAYVVGDNPQELIPQAPTYMSNLTWISGAGLAGWTLFGDDTFVYLHYLNAGLKVSSLLSLELPRSITGGSWLGNVFVGWGSAGVYRLDFGSFLADNPYTDTSGSVSWRTLLDLPLVISGEEAYATFSDPAIGDVERASVTYSVTRAYSGEDTEYTFASSPWGALETLRVIVVDANGDDPDVITGQELSASWDGSVLTVEGKAIANAVLMVGLGYEGYATLAPPPYRRQGGEPLVSGRQTVKRCSIRVRNAAFAQAERIRSSGTTHTTTWEHPYSASDELVLDSGEFTASIGGEASRVKLKLITASPYGAAFKRLVWDMDYNDN